MTVIIVVVLLIREIEQIDLQSVLRRKSSSLKLGFQLKPIPCSIDLGSSVLGALFMLQVVFFDYNGTPLDQRQLQGVF